MGWFRKLFGSSRQEATTAPPGRAAEPTPSALDRVDVPSRPTFVVVDVETTGLSPRADRVLEVAVVRLDHSGQVVDEWATRFNPEGPLGATHIHGITAADVASAPPFRELSTDLVGRLQGSVIVAHNARFDLAFLRAEFERSGWDLPYLPAFCTLEASDHYLPHLERRRLHDCCTAAGVRLDAAHSALGDARATAGLMHRYLSMPGYPVHAELATLPERALSVSWPPGPSRAPTASVRAMRSSSRPIRMASPRPKGAPLVHQLKALSLGELVDDGAPHGTLPYLELLVDVLEDGILADAESAALADITAIYELGVDDVAAAHVAFVTALAHRALDDGHVSRDERDELYALAGLLDVTSSTVRELIEHADQARAARLSAGLLPLPEDWSLGEPLRVGDKVVFTGGDEVQRRRLEESAERLGVRVMGGVSRQTAMLVTDGNFAGGKAAKAEELGTRTVHPNDFETLLGHLQPALQKSARPKKAPVATGSSAASGNDDRRVPAAGTDSADSDGRAPEVPVQSEMPNASNPAAIRAWAVENGVEVNARGRLPRSVVDAYRAAHREEP